MVWVYLAPRSALIAGICIGIYCVRHREYMFTNCCFNGPPPCGYDSWEDWARESINSGSFKGVEIKSIMPNESRSE